MTVLDIIRGYLRRHGYDGLCNTDIECGCQTDDLAPCGNVGYDCQPGVKEMQPDGDWLIVTGKKPEEMLGDFSERMEIKP